jgi:hypothetical protein
MVLCLFNCATRFTGESGCIGAISKAAVGVGFYAADKSFISNGIHGSPLKVKSDKRAKDRAKNTRAENVEVGWLFHGLPLV